MSSAMCSGDSACYRAEKGSLQLATLRFQPRRLLEETTLGGRNDSKAERLRGKRGLDWRTQKVENSTGALQARTDQTQRILGEIGLNAAKTVQFTTMFFGSPKCTVHLRARIEAGRNNEFDWRKDEKEEQARWIVSEGMAKGKE